MKLRVLYRGPLESCNYGCPYCPFAKRVDPPAALDRDRAALARFVAWAAGVRGVELGVLFTPWGEGLVRPWYREALVELSRMEHVARAAIQTNLSAPLGFLGRAVAGKLGIWATYHPGEVVRARFLAACGKLAAAGVRFSVGMVGLKEHLDEIEAMRGALPAGTYLWVNAVKRGRGYYAAGELARLRAVDPWFEADLGVHPSRGRRCGAGEESIAVDGDGEVRRCPFVATRLGNLYRDPLEAMLAPRPCPKAGCGCFLGYVNLAAAGVAEDFTGGLLERVPDGWGAGDAVGV